MAKVVSAGRSCRSNYDFEDAKSLSERDKQLTAVDTESELRKRFELKMLEKQKEAYESGYKKGLLDAVNLKKEESVSNFESKKKELEGAEDVLLSLISQLKQEREKIVHNYKSDLIEIVFESVTKILSEQISGDSYKVEATVSKLLDTYRDEGIVKVKLGEREARSLNTLESLQQKYPEIEFSCGEGADQTGVVLVSNNGELDFRLMTKLMQFIELLTRHAE
ncbi:FliH/SctL family protein [Vibrio vulnificus]|nr:hypothetical protein [Vibrio vulnificus]ELI3521929.1 hypothetical protein [Vibrio vulnificus]